MVLERAAIAVSHTLICIAKHGTLVLVLVGQFLLLLALIVLLLRLIGTLLLIVVLVIILVVILVVCHCLSPSFPFRV